MALVIDPTIVGRDEAVDPPRRVLIVSATVGEGHNTTGRALAQQARALWPDCEIRWIDTLDTIGPGVGPLTRWSYVHNVEKTPWLYEFAYDVLWRSPMATRAAKGLLGAVAGRRLAAPIAACNPDVIISTYPIGTAGLAWLRRRRGLSVPVAAWVSDFAPHPLWVYSAVNITHVMHPSVLGSARRGTPGAHVDVAAPAVDEAFVPGDRSAARRALRIGADRFVVVLTTGFYGFGSVESAVDTLLGLAPGVQVVVMCGRNERLRHKLAARTLPADRLLPLGWTDDVATYLTASDVVVTNAGGATALEALAIGRVVLMYRPIAAQGRANARVMAHAGLATLCPGPAELAEAVTGLLTDPAALAEGESVAASFAAGRQPAGDLRELSAMQPPRRPARPRALQPPPRTVRAEDTFFLYVQTENVPQQVGAVLLVEGRLPVERRGELVRRAGAILHGRRLSPGRFWWSRPQWVAGTPVGAGAHVRFRRCGADGLPGTISGAADAFFSAPLHGLWDIDVVEGPDDTTAVLIKVHHVLGDSFAVARTLIGLLDPLPKRPRPARPRPRPAGPHPAPGREPAGLRTRLARAPERLRTSASSASRIARGLASLALGGPAPRSGINGPMTGRGRRFVSFTLSSREVMRTARLLRTGSTAFILTLFAAAVGVTLAERGERTAGARIRVMVPRTVRAGTGRDAQGNWTAAVPVDVPIGPMPDAARLAEVERRLQAKLDGGVPEAASWVMRTMGVLLPAPLHAAAARAIYNGNWFNTIISVFPGHRPDRTLLGGRVSHAFPVLPLADEVGLAVGVMTWGDMLSFGITADTALLPDVDTLAAHVRDAYSRFRDDVEAGSEVDAGS